MSRFDCDLVIIGSGFGGAVCALRAAEAGLRVFVLERGNRLTPQSYEQMAEGKAPLFRGRKETGPLEFHRLKGLLALTASAVGGGSNIYTAVTIRPPAEIFDDRWPSGLTYERLSSCYDRVEAMIQPTPIPRTLPRTAALETIGERMGAETRRLPLSMTWPSDGDALCASPKPNGLYREVATWLRGGPVARKRTLSDSYLAGAEANGAEIRPGCEVVSIAPETGGYRVAFHRGQGDGGRDDSMSAARVVVSAGALNTVRLLLACRDHHRTLPNLSRTLGHGFYTNGDFGGLLAGPKLDLTPDAGPPVTSWVDLWQQEKMYVMETGLVPYDFGSFTGLLNPARWFSRMKLAPAKCCTWSFGVMGRNDNPGRLLLNRRGVLVHRHDPARGQPFLDRSVAVLRDLSEAAGGKLIVPPPVFVRRLPFTVHPLGGAAMADSPETGVVNPVGEIFGHPGLFIADGSLMPTPVGAPPSMTIAAVAEYICEHLVEPC